MPVHSIYVPRENYRGSKQSLIEKRDRFNYLAQTLENYLNNQFEIEKAENCIYDYDDIAITHNLKLKEVRDVLFEVGGWNGITISRKAASHA